MATTSHPHPRHFSIVLISSVAAIGGFLFGFDSGVINGTVEALQAAFRSTSVGSGFNVASMLLGCAVGAFLAGNLADKMGRRPVMLIAAVFFAVSAWGSGIAESSGEFVIYRVLGGFAVGAASVICPAYISEIAPASVRGRLASLQQLAIVLGLFFAFLSNFLLARASGGAAEVFWWGFQAWQWMFWVELLPAGVFFFALLLIPESPRFLAAYGREAQARQVIGRLEPHGDADKKIAEIRATLDQHRKPRLTDLWDSATRRIHPVVWVGIGLAAFQQLVGINVVFYYGAVLWQAAGFSEAHALSINVLTGAVNIGSTFVAMALVDRWGRKPLLIFGSLGMGLALGTLTVVFGMSKLSPEGALHLSPTTGWVALLAANAYVFCFGVSWGPVMWVMLGEMFQNQIRGAALSVSGFAQWMANFAVTMTFPLLLTTLGLGGAYGLYTLCALVSAAFVARWIRETRGKSLEEM